MKSDKLKKPFKITLTLIVMTAVLFQLGCASQPSSEPDKPVEVVENTKQGPDEDVVRDYDGEGMKMPLDGTSLAAFDASLAKVERNTSPDNYKALTNAIDYLMIYDLSARGNREKLAANLNGQTGFQVVGKVRWRRPAPGKGQAEKDAADAKIEY